MATLMRLLIFICITLLILDVCSGDINCDGGEVRTKCNAKKSCGDCIRESECCSWCYDPTNWKSTEPRCDLLHALVNNGQCNADFILKGVQNELNIEKDDPFSNTNGSNAAMQIKPQAMHLRMRNQSSFEVEFNYRQAGDYPMDLYFLIDLTNSMVPQRDALVRLGNELSELLKNLTINHRLAFGYYADKTEMPFFLMLPDLLENPCNTNGQTCSKPFTFVHSHDFSSDTKAFIAKVNESRFTSNQDDLEAGLEAVMEVLHCDQMIRWNRESRKMIVMATNSLLHWAGDGLLAGVVRKYERGCHLNDEGVLANYMEYDYPSLEEVGKSLENKKVKLILTGMTGDNQETFYSKLNLMLPDVTEFLPGEKTLASIEYAYKSLMEAVDFRDDAPKQYVETTYSSTCNNSISYGSHVCHNLTVGKDYTFKVNVKLLDIPKDQKSLTIKVYNFNIEENLIINLDFINECDCSDDDHQHRKYCGSHGTYSCGICKCADGWYGDNCENKCTIDVCRINNSLTCNARGDCDLEGNCGCVCDEQYSGPFCEYENCERHEGKICSGNGECIKGECLCQHTHFGPNCACAKSKESCIGMGNNKKVCSGRGSCECGKCVCEKANNDEGSAIYYGAFCEEMHDILMCDHEKNCVLSRIDGVAPNHYKKQTCDHDVIELTEVGEDEKFACNEHYYDNLGRSCTVLYRISPDDFSKIQVTKPDCLGVTAASTKALIYIGLIIVLLGCVFLAIWRIYAIISDKREFAKFEKEKENVKFGTNTNELYVSPITIVQNPMYRTVENRQKLS